MPCESAPWTLAAYPTYCEFGWGGFWFWIFGVNASFIPWSIAAALLHHNVVVLKRWTLLLAGLGFEFLCGGAQCPARRPQVFHAFAFAIDLERGVVIPIISVFSQVKHWAFLQRILVSLYRRMCGRP